MGDVIDFKSRLEEKIRVELENDGQRLLEAAIVGLWDVVDGFHLQDIVDQHKYHMFFLSFADVCFEQLERGNITVDEDGNVGINTVFKEVLANGIRDLKRELATNDNIIDGSD